MKSLDDQLTKYLTDAHSIEQQALAQMRVAPELAGDPEIASAFSQHLTETEGHERLVRERLSRPGARRPRRSRISPARSPVKGLRPSRRPSPIPPASSSRTPSPTSTWSWPPTTCWAAL